MGSFLDTYTGAWSVFKICLSRSTLRCPVPLTNLEWIMESNSQPVMLIKGKEESYSYQLQVNGFNPFLASELSGMRCVPQVAH